MWTMILESPVPGDDLKVLALVKAHNKSPIAKKGF